MTMEQEIIDLCSGSEEEKEAAKPSLAKKRRLHQVLDLTEESTPNNNPRQKQWRVASSLLKTSTPPLIFVSSGDSCVLTGGLPKLLSAVSPPLETVVKLEALQHIQQGDKWSCGFRNTQMMLSALVPLLPPGHSYWSYNAFQEHCVEIPSLQHLQQHIEDSWTQGFDPNGAKHYRHHMVGKREWIGAVEVSHVLAFNGVDSTVVQFIKCWESRQLLPRFCLAYFGASSSSMTTLPESNCLYCHDDSGSARSSRAMVQDLLLAAEKKKTATPSSVQPCPACQSRRLPLYLQWNGHSVTVVGVERNAQGSYHLLVFDPLKKGTLIKNALEQGSTQPLRLDFAKVEKKDCQLLVCSTRSLSVQEREGIKEVTSAVTAAESAVLRFVKR